MKTRLYLSLFTLLFAIAAQHSLHGQSWLITGNGNTTVGPNFLGTTNNTGLAFRTNNVERMRLTNKGNLGIGLTSNFAGAKLQVANGGAVSLTTPGHVVLGQTDSVNLGMDTSVIQARNNGAASSLFLNYLGGPVWIGNHGGSPGIYLTADGFVGIGTDTPSPYGLKVSHGSFGLDIENNSSLDDWELVCFSSLQLYFNGFFRGSFNSTTGAYTSISDERLKSNIQPMPAVLDRISQLRPSSYQFKNGDAKVYDGFIGQEVEQVFPTLVTHLIEPERGLDVYTLDYSGFGVIAIQGLQELEQTIEIQQQRIATLEERIARLEAAFNRRN